MIRFQNKVIASNIIIHCKLLQVILAGKEYSLNANNSVEG
jgi:hypothetical protein